MRHSSLLLAGAVLAAGLTTATEAATITSADFTIHIGRSEGPPPWPVPSLYGGEWSEYESSGVNSPHTQGNFSFTPTIGSSGWSAGGPIFPNGVLSNDPVDGVEPNTGYDLNFSNSITASYNGAAPGNAAAIPNYRLRLEIDMMRIYSVGYADATTVNWSEAGNGSSTPTAVGAYADATPNDIGLASTYTPVTWNPNDPDVVLASLNDPVIREFTFVRTAGTYAVLDGYTVTGRVVLVYDAIPEPASLSLLLLGGAGVLARRRV